MRFFVTRFGYTLVVIALLLASALVLFAQRVSIGSSFPSSNSFWPAGGFKSHAHSNRNISYDLSTPPSVGCENLVNDLQQRLIQAYTKRLKGIRYANIWGYLETENKGDAAIWSAQQMLLTTLGIETMEACRFLHKECDVEKFTRMLDEHRPHSGIIMAGGGNFNDYYWEDQPSRMKMIETFTNTSIRAFPQSIFMTKPDRIEATKKAFTKHKDLQLAARDRPSWEWLDNTFGASRGIDTDLVPDIAFMWGNRSDFRINTKKTHDILILARKDMEISAGDSADIPFGEGELDLGGTIGNVTYRKVDWKFTHTPDINGPDDKYPDDSPKETGKNQRAWAKSIAGFDLLGSARFVMTDRLHGHILSTVIGVPHVLMDSKLGKNLNFHNTWTRDCECTRIATNISEARDIARLYFEKEKKDNNPTNFLGQAKGQQQQGPVRISLVETAGTHDEVSSALIHALGGHPNAELSLFLKLQRYGSAEILRNFTLEAPIKTVKSSNDFKAAVESEPAPQILISTTCELDMEDGHFLNPAQKLLENEKTHLLCIVHHADRWTEGKHVREILKWVEQERVDFIGLSQHTMDFFEKNTVPKWETKAKVTTHVLPPVFPMSVPDFDPATAKGLDLAMQGDYAAERRNYKGIFGNLGNIIQKFERDSSGDEKDSVTLHLIGHGAPPAVPDDIKAHVKFDHDLSYPAFYTILSKAFSVLPAFASDTYYDRKASSSVPASLIAGAPLVANEKLLAAYSYLPREATWVAKNGEEELDVVERVVGDRKAYAKKRELIQKTCKDLAAQNRKKVQKLVDVALKKASLP